jgi:hypothetical protein
MRGNQILAITFCTLACLDYPNRSANAGWFGPSNFEECVVSEMKGEPSNVYLNVMHACDIRFPCEDDMMGPTSRMFDHGGACLNTCVHLQTGQTRQTRARARDQERSEVVID